MDMTGLQIQTSQVQDMIEMTTTELPPGIVNTAGLTTSSSAGYPDLSTLSVLRSNSIQSLSHQPPQQHYIITSTPQESLQQLQQQSLLVSESSSSSYQPQQQSSLIRRNSLQLQQYTGSVISQQSYPAQSHSNHNQSVIEPLIELVAENEAPLITHSTAQPQMTTIVGHNDMNNSSDLPILEQCSICSANYEKPRRVYPQPDMNRLLTKLLDITPNSLTNGSSFFSQYVAACVECIKKVKKYERLRNEMDVIKQDVISSLTDSFLYIQPKANPVMNCLKQPFLDRWVNRVQVPIKASKGKAYGSRKDTKSAMSKKPSRILPKEHFMTPLMVQDTSGSIKLGPWQLAGEVNIFTTDPQGTSDSQQQQFVTAYVTDLVDAVGDDVGNDLEFESNDDANQFHQGSPIKKRRLNSSNQTRDKDENSKEDSGLNIPEEKRQRQSAPEKAKQHEQPPFFCESCGRVFSLLKSLRHHAAGCSEEPTTPSQCTICFADFSQSTWLDLKFHIDLAHSEECQLDKCRHCRMEFLPNSINSHECVFESSGNAKAIKPHSEYKCDFCDKTYFHTNSLGHHVRRHHKGEKLLTCPICSRTYTASAILNSHMVTHQTTPFRKNSHKCEECGIFCSTSWGLRQHQTIHSGAKQYQCEHCGRKFRLYQAWRSHEVVHTRERKHSCHICGKMFGLYCTMSRHVKRHINPLPQLPKEGETCPICKDSHAFLKLSVLKGHMLKKHPGTKEQFEICRRIGTEEDNKKGTASKGKKPRRLVKRSPSKASTSKKQTTKKQTPKKAGNRKRESAEYIIDDSSSESEGVEEIEIKEEQDSDIEEVPVEPSTTIINNISMPVSSKKLKSTANMSTSFQGLKKVSVKLHKHSDSA